ncbi:MAG: flagellar basal body rod C-terminal domain-containing protein [Dissulfurispiraceae bacterium]
MTIGNIINSASSAINAFSFGLNVTGNNVANMQTNGFKPSTAEMNEDSNGGVRVTLSQSQNAGVDPAQEMTEMMIEQIGVEANIKAMQTGNQVIKSLVDLKV